MMYSARSLATVLGTVLAAMAGRVAFAASPGGESQTSACDQISWELGDVLRELLEQRVGASGVLAPGDLEVALRRRQLPFVNPVFRYAPGGGELAPESPGDGERPSTCRVHADPNDRHGSAAFRVEAPVRVFSVEPSRGRWRVAITAPSRAFESPAELVFGGVTGLAQRYAVSFVGDRAELVIPRPRDSSGSPKSLESLVFQLVAVTEKSGPEVVAELWPGHVDFIAAARQSQAHREAVAYAERAPETSSDGFLVSSLNARRKNLARPPLVLSAALGQVARQTLDDALLAGRLAHRTTAGLVGDRLRAAGFRRRLSGELLARVAKGALAASKFYGSPAHRAVLSDASFDDVGVASAPGPDGLDWVVVLLATRH